MHGVQGNSQTALMKFIELFEEFKVLHPQYEIKLVHSISPQWLLPSLPPNQEGYYPTVCLLL